MKKSNILLLAICIFAILLSNLIFVSAQDSLERVAEIAGVDSEEVKDLDPSNLQGNIEGVKNKTLSKWGYLGEEWKKLFLRNKVVASIDGFLQKLDKLFFILMREHYSFSLEFFVLLVLWLVFGSRFGEFFSEFLNFNEWGKFFVWLLSGSAFSVLMSYLSIYQFIIYLPTSEYFKNVVWWLGILLWVLFIFILIVLYYLSGTLKAWALKMKEKKAKERGELEREKLHGVVKGIEEGREG